jgi:hypothetical protein
MTTHSFQLQPFPGSLAPDIRITGVITRDRQQLNIAYMVAGAIDTIQLPALNPHPTRQWELWETTCLECFIGLPAAANYWEFNLAPNGNWNAFALTAYREGIAEAAAVESIVIATDRPADRFTLSTTMPLNAIIPTHAPLEMSVTAVIQTLDQSLSYWAIAHCGDAADFHRRDSFQLTIS